MGGDDENLGQSLPRGAVNYKMVGVSYLSIQVRLKGFFLLSAVSDNEEL